jgi:hypothetical protein
MKREIHRAGCSDRPRDRNDDRLLEPPSGGRTNRATGLIRSRKQPPKNIVVVA